MSAKYSSAKQIKANGSVTCSAMYLIESPRHQAVYCSYNSVTKVLEWSIKCVLTLIYSLPSAFVSSLVKLECSGCNTFAKLLQVIHVGCTVSHSAASGCIPVHPPCIPRASRCVSSLFCCQPDPPHFLNATVQCNRIRRSVFDQSTILAVRNLLCFLLPSVFVCLR